MRPLSYSSFSTYNECPLKYKLKYIDGLKEKPKSYLSFGSSLHDALQFFYSYHPPPASLHSVLEYYEKNWIPEGYANSEEEEGYFVYGKRILTDYYNMHIKAFKTPVAVEHQFNIEIQGVPVTGFIDRIDKIQDNKAEIIDYKSSKNIFDRSDVEENEQLTLYQLAVEESIGLEVGKLTLYHLPSQTPVNSGPRIQEEKEALKRRIEEVAELISKGEFEPREGRFCPCDFPEHCPFYKHKYVIEKEERKKKTDIQQTIEEYSRLKDQERDINKRINDLGETIHTYCDEQKLSRVFGKEHAITRIKTERKGFDEEKLRAILEPKDLWDKVVNYNDSQAKAFLEDEDLDPDLKNEIRKLEVVKKTYYQLRIKDFKEGNMKVELDKPQ